MPRAPMLRTTAVLLLASCAGLAAQSESYERLVADFERAAGEDAAAAVAEFLPRFEAAAAAHRGEEAAVPFLSWIVQNGRLGPEVPKALEALAAEHGRSLALGPVLEVLPNLATYFGDEVPTRLVEAVLAAGSPPELQARAMFARATMMLSRAEAVDDGALRDAGRDLEQARKLTKDPALTAAMAPYRAAPRGLAIGDRLPEVAGFDLDGRPFRLSDYRGKVVVLDFWGDW